MSTRSAASRADEDAILEPALTASFTRNANRGSQVGQNLGTVINHLHDRSETPSTPLSLVPFPRDPQFVDRGVLLDQIHERCLTQKKWTALVGLGGVGTARFEQSFQDIVDTVRIYGRENSQMNVFHAVHSWLRDPKNGQWIVILDSLDDPDFLTTSRSSHGGFGAGVDREEPRFLGRYIPHASHGSVLLTTRNRAVAMELVDKDDIIPVGPMDEKQGVALLKKKLGQDVARDDGQVSTLAATLDSVPLAMVQAAAYISNLKYSTQEYLDTFQKSDRKKQELLSYDQELGYLRRDFEAQHAITATWQISFDHLRQTRRSAADLLSLIGFFDPQAIPRMLLECRPTSHLDSEGVASSNADDDDDDDDDDDGNDGRASESGDSPGLRQDLRTLESCSFISVNEDASTIGMHSLVQLATRSWLQDYGQAALWKEKSVTHLHMTFAAGDAGDWAQCQALFPHVKSAMSQTPKKDSSLRDWAEILYRGAIYSYLKGNADDMEEMSIKATKAFRRVLEPDHRRTLLSTYLTGQAYMVAGKWTDAEVIFRDVSEKFKKGPGVDYLELLMGILTIYDPGWIHYDRGRLSAAQSFNELLLGMFKGELGSDDPYILSRISNLVSLFSRQGRHVAAEESEKQATVMSKAELGEDHPDMLLKINQLVLTHQRQSRFKAAEKIVNHVLDIRKKSLGPDHPQTLTIMNDLAFLHRSRGHQRTARDLETHVPEASRKTLRPDDLDAPRTGEDSALTAAEEKGCWKATRDFNSQMAEMFEGRPELDDRGALNSTYIMAFIYRRQGRLDMAVELGTRMMDMSKAMLGKEHPATLLSMRDLARTWGAADKRADAVRLMEECVQLKLHVLGTDHPHTKSSSALLAGWKAEDGSDKDHAHDHTDTGSQQGQ